MKRKKNPLVVRWEGAGTLGAASPRFLAGHASSRTMPSSAPQFTTPPSPDHAPYLYSEPLIVSDPAGAEGGHGCGVAPASPRSYPLQEAMSGGKVQPSKRQVRVCSLFACMALSCRLHVC